MDLHYPRFSASEVELSNDCRHIWHHAHNQTASDGKIHGVLAFSSALNGFPCPFDCPFGGDLTSVFLGTVFDGAAAALAFVGAAGAALAGTAGVFAFTTGRLLIFLGF